MKRLIHVFLHEVTKVLLDKKMLASIFLLPVVIVLMTSFLMTGTREDTQVQISTIYVLNNALPAEDLAEDIRLVPVEDESVEALSARVKLQPEDVVFEIRDMQCVIYYNATNGASRNLSLSCKQMIVEGVLELYAASNGVELVGNDTLFDLNSNADAGTNMMAVLFPYMLVLLLFQSTSGYAVDTIAGEKERGVFSKLLLTPVSPVPIIGGKLLSSVVCGVLSTGAYIGISVGAALITGKDAMGILEADLTPAMIGLLICCAVLLSWFFANLSVLCSLYARTVKAANTMKLPVYGASMVLALAAMLRIGAASSVHYLIPVYNISIMMQDILNNSMEIENMAITVASLLVCSLIVSGVTVVSFRKEAVRC
jgi:sodium transport system permease protein